MQLPTLRETVSMQEEVIARLEGMLAQAAQRVRERHAQDKELEALRGENEYLRNVRPGSGLFGCHASPGCTAHVHGMLKGAGGALLKAQVAAPHALLLRERLALPWQHAFAPARGHGGPGGVGCAQAACPGQRGGGPAWSNCSTCATYDASLGNALVSCCGPAHAGGA